MFVVVNITLNKNKNISYKTSIKINRISSSIFYRFYVFANEFKNELKNTTFTRIFRRNKKMLSNEKNDNVKNNNINTLFLTKLIAINSLYCFNFFNCRRC